MKNHSISRIIRALRAQLAITQEGFAQELGMSWKTISRYENEKWVPSGASLISLIHFAEDKGQTEIAARLRDAYIAQSYRE